MKKSLIIISCALLILTGCNKAKAPDTKAVEENKTANEQVNSEQQVKIEEEVESSKEAEGYIKSIENGEIVLSENEDSTDDSSNITFKISEDIAKNLKIGDKIKISYNKDNEIESIDTIETTGELSENIPEKKEEVDLEDFNEYDSYEFENFEVALYTDAEIDDSGEVMWDTGHNYKVVLYDNDANAHILFDDFLQHGEITVEEDEKDKDTFKLVIEAAGQKDTTKFKYEDGKVEEVK